MPWHAMVCHGNALNQNTIHHGAFSCADVYCSLAESLNIVLCTDLNSSEASAVRLHALV